MLLKILNLRVQQLSELRLGKESDAIDTQSLKTAKLYLKVTVDLQRPNFANFFSLFLI